MSPTPLSLFISSSGYFNVNGNEVKLAPSYWNAVAHQNTKCNMLRDGVKGGREGGREREREEGREGRKKGGIVIGTLLLIRIRNVAC